MALAGSGGWWNRTHLITVRDHYYHAENCLVDTLGGGGELEHKWTSQCLTSIVLVSCFYCTVLSHTANCCCRDKLNCTASQSQGAVWQWPLCATVFITLCYISCISPSISHPLCCKLAQVVSLSSPPFNVKLSVWLPSSCNAVPLMAKATTQNWRSVSPSDGTRYSVVIEWADGVGWIKSGRRS